METKIQELLDTNKEILQYIRDEKANKLRNDQWALPGLLFAISGFCLLFAILMLVFDIILQYKRYHDIPISNMIWTSVLWVVGIVLLIVGIHNI